MSRRRLPWATFAIILVASSAAQRVASARELPPLLPRETFFPTPPAMQALRLSPDGRLLSYQQPDAAGVVQLWVRDLDAGTTRQLTRRPAPGVTGYVWAENGQIVCYQYRDGANERLAGVDRDTLREWPLVAIDGAQIGDFVTRPAVPDEMLFSLRLSGTTDADVYRLNVRTGQPALDTKNPGGVPSNQFYADAQLRVRAAQRMTKDAGAEVLVRDRVVDQWRSWLTADSTYIISVEAFTGDGTELLLRSDLRSDMSRLVARRLRDARERDVAGAADLDVENVLLHPRTGAVQAVSFLRDPRQWQALDSAVGAELRRVAALGPGHVGIVSRDRADTRWLVSISPDRAGRRLYLWNRNTRKAVLVLDEQPHLAALPFAPSEPIAFKARDGLTIHGYLRVPPGVAVSKLPTVVWVHGGPYLRDSWGLDLLGQFFVNRGYAFLRLNFRGSRGYGRSFRLTSLKQWGGTMQDDVNDAVDHLVLRGVADPARIAILGHSYGGYVALAAIAMTPDRYACAAASSTTTNLVTFVSRFPRTSGNQWLRDTVGDPELPADAEMLRRVSPITYVDRVSKPVIVARGDRDDAVPPGDLDAFVDGVGRRGQSATLIVYEGDGHFYRRANELDYYARVEALLARRLGGRAEPMREGGEPGATARVRVAGPAASDSGKMPDD